MLSNLKRGMQIAFTTFTVRKRFPLTISRGTTAETTNLWVRIEAEGIEGWGEASPFSIGEHRQPTEVLLQAFEAACELLADLHPLQRQEAEHRLREAGIPTAARAALDMAMLDWLGKRAGLPLWQLLGLSRERIVPPSATIGINPPEVARQRVHDWLEQTQYGYSRPRDWQPYPWPSGAMELPLVVLMNERSFSNAEMFPYSVRAKKLGTLVGWQTPGYVIATWGLDLVDGTGARMPQLGVYRKDGSNMENNGEAPDIAVWMSPDDWVNERDPQLDKAIEVLMSQLEKR